MQRMAYSTTGWSLSATTLRPWAGASECSFGFDEVPACYSVSLIKRHRIGVYVQRLCGRLGRRSIAAAETTPYFKCGIQRYPLSQNLSVPSAWHHNVDRLGSYYNPAVLRFVILSCVAAGRFEGKATERSGILRKRYLTAKVFSAGI